VFIAVPAFSFPLTSHYRLYINWTLPAAIVLNPSEHSLCHQTFREMKRRLFVYASQAVLVANVDILLYLFLHKNNWETLGTFFHNHSHNMPVSLRFDKLRCIYSPRVPLQSSRHNNVVLDRCFTKNTEHMALFVSNTHLLWSLSTEMQPPFQGDCYMPPSNLLQSGITV
jgi:hypothetical protein